MVHSKVLCARPYRGKRGYIVKCCVLDPTRVREGTK